jgi:hypothetical protein
MGNYNINKSYYTVIITTTKELWIRPVIWHVTTHHCTTVKSSFSIACPILYTNIVFDLNGMHPVVYIYIYIKLRRKCPSHNNARIGSKHVQSIVTCFYSKMLLHVSAFLIGHHQAYIKMLKLSWCCMYLF